jgi:FAD/FMN-containing dehydrogenase
MPSTSSAASASDEPGDGRGDQQADRHGLPGSGALSTGSCYFNFADRPTDLEAIFAPETLERLRDVKRRYDPDGLISGNHNISLA